MAERKRKYKKTYEHAGQPTKFKEEYCQMLIGFFDVEPFEDVEIPHYKNGELSWIDKKRMATRLPTIRRFAKSINVCVATVYNWLDEKHESFQPKFLDAFKHVASLRKEFLIENGLQGTHNALYAKFVAMNLTDMTDRQEHLIDGNLNITITNYGSEHNDTP